MRRTLVALALAFGIATTPAIAVLDLRDDRLPAERAERLLQEPYGTPYGFACKKQDEHVSIELDDVDYLCLPEDRNRFAYWIGTDESRITQAAPLP
jgi:hypothetical protein